MKRAIKSHAADFVAIIALLIGSIAVSGYILHHERLRFPFIESTPFTVNAQFSTAQAVTPGQGQTVRVSGVQIGMIGGVTLQNGIAVVKMDIDKKFKHLIHTNASALLRPKTGLKDMFVELDPGTTSAPVVKPGFTIPVSRTEPDINLDEFLSTLDVDTRQYLELLINGAGQGLAGRGDDLAQVLERFEPTHQDLARLNGAIAVRRTDLRQLVNSLARLNSSLEVKRAQISNLVTASSVVFRAFASEDGNISRAIADLPATLRQTTSTLDKVRTFADLLGPTTRSLIPAALALPAANNSVAALAEPSAPIIQKQIRPFVVAARPLVRNLRPAAVNLNAATPGIRTTFTVLNHLVNMLNFVPGGGQHSYIWWLAWLDHNARTVFSIQDANSDFRPLFLEANCSSLSQIAQNVTGSGAILNITQILSDAQLCPTQAKAITDSYRSPTGVLHANGDLCGRLPNLPAPQGASPFAPSP